MNVFSMSLYGVKWTNFSLRIRHDLLVFVLVLHSQVMETRAVGVLLLLFGVTSGAEQGIGLLLRWGRGGLAGEVALTILGSLLAGGILSW